MQTFSFLALLVPITQIRYNVIISNRITSISYWDINICIRQICLSAPWENIWKITLYITTGKDPAEIVFKKKAHKNTSIFLLVNIGAVPFGKDSEHIFSARCKYT